MIKTCRLAITIFAVLTSLAAQATEASTPRRTLDPELEAAMVKRSSRHPFAELSAWTREHVRPDWLPANPRLQDAKTREVLICALWSKDPATRFAAACHLPEWILDLKDIERWVDAVWPHVLDEKTRYDWNSFKHLIDTRQVRQMLTPKQTWKTDIRGHFVHDLHRSFRAEHIPALCQLIHHDDPIVRAQAFRVLDTLSKFTDQHRVHIATEILKWPGPSSFRVGDYDDSSTNPKYTPRSFRLPSDTGGYPPLLHACLQRWFLEIESSEFSNQFLTFLLRWAEDSTPGESDRDLLCALLKTSRPTCHWIALRALQRVEADRDTLRALQTFAAEADPDLRPLILAASSREDELRILARDDSGALAVRLEMHTDEAWREWSERAFGEDIELGLRSITLLDEARELSLTDAYRYPSSIDDRLRCSINQHVEDMGVEDMGVGEMDFERLARLAQLFPSCRTRTQADRLLRELTPARLLKFGLVAMFEVHDPKLLRTKLTAWVTAPASPAQNQAVRILMRLGTTERAPEILELALAAEGETDLFLIARSGSSKLVRRYLQDALLAEGPDTGGTALAALATARGIPEATARSWAKWQNRRNSSVWTSNWDNLVSTVIEKDPVDALIMMLEAVPIGDQCFTNLGLIDDERIRTLLRRVRNTPGTNVQKAIAELALAGDSAAQEQMSEVRSRHLYGWVDSTYGFARSGGITLDLMQYWVDEIGTNCCRRNVASQAIEKLTDYRVHNPGEDGLLSQHEHALTWWHAAREQLRWSRYKDRFVIAPR